MKLSDLRNLIISEIKEQVNTASYKEESYSEVLSEWETFAFRSEPGSGEGEICYYIKSLDSYVPLIYVEFDDVNDKPATTDALKRFVRTNKMMLKNSIDYNYKHDKDQKYYAVKKGGLITR